MRRLIAAVLLAVSFSFTGENLKWYADFNEASQIASKENKNVLIYFSGSDWCKPCIQLSERVFETTAWQKFAHEHLILVQADFPRLKKNQPDAEQVRQNELLAEKYNQHGEFPSVVLVDPQGRELFRVTYHQESAEEYIGILARQLKH